MKNAVPLPPQASLKTISEMPELKHLVKKWQAEGSLGIDIVREMMRYTQDIVRANRTPKLAKVRDTLESIVSKYEMGK